MIYTKNYNWSIQSTSGDQSITLSEYDKATITYDKEYEVVVTEDAAEQIADVAKVITEEEYNKLKEEQQAKLQTI